MPNYEATHYNFTGQYMTGLAGVNTGLIIPWGSASVPSGFLECNGQSVSTSTYAALFAVIGYTYGGSGASFLVPDLQDKISLSKSNTKALASTGGANTVALTGNVSGSIANATLTSAQIPSHTHNYFYSQNQTSSGMGGGGGTNSAMTSGSAGGGGAHGHSANFSITGSATSVLQPYLTLIYIIKT